MTFKSIPANQDASQKERLALQKLTEQEQLKLDRRHCYVKDLAKDIYYSVISDWIDEGHTQDKDMFRAKAHECWLAAESFYEEAEEQRPPSLED
jgi:hypothetical protein